MYYSGEYCTVLYYTVQILTVLVYAVLYLRVLDYELYCTVLHCCVYCTILYCASLYCTVVYCTIRSALHMIVPHCSVLYRTALGCAFLIVLFADYYTKLSRYSMGTVTFVDFVQYVGEHVNQSRNWYQFQLSTIFIDRLSFSLSLSLSLCSSLLPAICYSHLL